MSDLTLTKKRLQAGVWEGELTYHGTGNFQPELAALHLDQPVAGINVQQVSDSKVWNVQVPVPVDAVSDGVHTIVIHEVKSGELLGDFTLIAGEPLAEDIRTETALLRAELDMLKRAFRRHCLETS